MKIDDFKTAVRLRRANLAAQIILGVLLYLGLNFLASRHFEAVDFSAGNSNSLSAETVAYVRNMNEGVDIYEVVSAKARDIETKSLMANLGKVLRQYEYASKKTAPIRVHKVDSLMDTKAAEMLAARFGSDIENSVIVAGKKRFRKIPVSDFYSSESSNPMNKTFNGERLITTAILAVTSEKPRRIFFLKGHGEMSHKSSSASRGLSEFAAMLAAANFEVGELDLSAASEVPANVDMLVIAAPTAPMLPRELDAVKKYLLKNNGRVAVFLPLGSLCGLEDILYEWGIRSEDMLVLDSSGDYESGGGDLIARAFPQNPHPISKYLISAEMPVQFGSVRPVMQDMGSPIDDSLTLSPLILSGTSSWAEKSYRRGGMQQYDSLTDLRGPMPLAMIATREGGNELGVRIPGGKLAVFGDEDFISNSRINRLGNAKLAFNTIRWMFDDNEMLNIPPKKVDIYTLTLSRNQIEALALRFMIAPAAILALCVVVWLFRRR